MPIVCEKYQHISNQKSKFISSWIKIDIKTYITYITWIWVKIWEFCPRIRWLPWFPWLLGLLRPQKIAPVASTWGWDGHAPPQGPTACGIPSWSSGFFESGDEKYSKTSKQRSFGKSNGNRYWKFGKSIGGEQCEGCSHARCSNSFKNVSRHWVNLRFGSPQYTVKKVLRQQIKGY